MGQRSSRSAAGQEQTFDQQRNPFLHLRLGQVLLDIGEEAGAADELMRAYMGGGAEIFSSEESRYLDFLGTKAKL